MPSEEEEEFAACSVIVVSDVFSLLVFVAGLNFWGIVFVGVCSNIFKGMLKGIGVFTGILPR